MCHRVRMNRSVGRCSVRMRQGPAKCFFFSPSILKKVERTGEQTEQGQTTQSSPNAQGVVRASFSWPPFPVFFSHVAKPAAVFLLCAGGLVLFCFALCLVLSCLCCCCCCCCCQHADNNAPLTRTPRQHCPQLPNQLPNLYTPSTRDKVGARTRHRHLLSCSARRSVPFHVPRPAKLRNTGLLAGH